jgi:hypothetical protein
MVKFIPLLPPSSSLTRDRTAYQMATDKAFSVTREIHHTLYPRSMTIAIPGNTANKHHVFHCAHPRSAHTLTDRFSLAKTHAARRTIPSIIRLTNQLVFVSR